MSCETPSFQKLNEAFEFLRSMDKFDCRHGNRDIPSMEAYRVFCATIAAILYPRVDTFRLSDGINTIKRDNEYDLLLTRNIYNLPLGKYQRNPHVEAYIDKNTCVVLTSREEKFAYVSLASNFTGKWVKLASAIPQILPWYFEKHPLNETETAFLKMLSAYETDKFSSDEFEALCSALYFQNNLDKIGIEMAVEKLTKQNLRNRIDSLKRDISCLRENIAAYERSCYEAIHNLHEKELTLNALIINNKNGSNELVEFLANSNIGSFKVKTDGIEFTVRSLLSCYDEGEIDAYVLNNERVLTGSCTWDLREEIEDMPYSEYEMRAFYKAVFIDHVFTIKLAAKYLITYECDVYAVSTDDRIDANRINNPNIGYAGCLGGYRADLNQAARNKDPVAAMAICQQSACSVNLGEIWPMARMTQDLVETNGRVIQTADGDITFREAMEQIRANINKE